MESLWPGTEERGLRNGRRIEPGIDQPEGLGTVKRPGYRDEGAAFGEYHSVYKSQSGPESIKELADR